MIRFSVQSTANSTSAVTNSYLFYSTVPVNHTVKFRRLSQIYAPTIKYQIFYSFTGDMTNSELKQRRNKGS